MMDHMGQVKLIQAAGVDRIAWLEEANLPPKLDTMFPELAGKTTILRQKEGEMTSSWDWTIPGGYRARRTRKTSLPATSD